MPTPSSADGKDPILAVHGLRKHFPIRRGIFRRTVGHLKAVDGIDLDVYRGETLGLAGESGCGKTTAVRTMIRAHEPTAGRVVFYPPPAGGGQFSGGACTAGVGRRSGAGGGAERLGGASETPTRAEQARPLNGDDLAAPGIEVMDLPHDGLRELWRDIQYVFQDPYGSLDPRMTVRDIVAEPLVIHRLARGRELSDRVAELLRRVGLDAAHMLRYPHAFSGGQRQRIGIARALALRPRLLMLDEPVSALDVSVRAQVLNLLMDLQQELHLTYLIVAHDLAVLERFCDRIAIMYLGRIVELAETKEIFSAPVHPYTRALLSAIPVADPTVTMNRQVLQGETLDLMNLPPGCKFAARCPQARAQCRTSDPPLHEITPGHHVRCLLSAAGEARSHTL